MDSITKGETIKCIFNIDDKNIFVTVAYTGEYSEFEGNKSYFFTNTKTNVEYSFTLSQIKSFLDAQARHEQETIDLD